MSEAGFVTENYTPPPSDIQADLEVISDALKDLKLDQVKNFESCSSDSAVGDSLTENVISDGESNELNVSGATNILEESNHIPDNENCLNDEVSAEIKTEESKSSDENEWVYILGHDQLKKRVLKGGNENDGRPSKGQVVEVRCCGRLEDGKKVDEFEKLQLTLGEEELVLALDLCIPLMNLGEVCELVTESRFAYGKHGRVPDIPADSRITYEVELLSFRDQIPYSELPLGERIQVGDRKRIRGNEYYKRGDFSKSLTEYMRALKILEAGGDAVGNNENENHALFLETRLKCYNNMAAAQVMIEAWDAASTSCDEVLKYQPDNVKALYRKGKCMASMGNTKAALTHYREVARLTPDSKAILREIMALEKKSKKEDESEKALYQKMLGFNDKKLLEKENKNSDWWKYLAGALVAAVVSISFVTFRYSGE